MDISYYKNMEPFWGVWYIDKELGSGSYGTVFSIKREDFGETYYSALKVISIPNDKSEIGSLKSEGLDEDSISQYFDSFASELVKEFALMAKIKGHSNIVSYEDHMTKKREGELGYDIFIRMELLTPLNDYIQKEAVTERTVAALGADICKALEACEKHNIIHRDIKPENVFVSGLGSYKLGDFGVSRVASQATQGMSIKGTISYMAPEVYKGQKYNSTVDIYSLGIMMYKLINNNRGPFLPPAPSLIKYADRENAENLRMSGTELPDAVNASADLMYIIRKAAAYNSADRYKTATEMRKDLEILLAGGKLSDDRTVSAVSFDKASSEEDKTVSAFGNTNNAKPAEIYEDGKTVAVAANQPVKQEAVAPVTATVTEKAPVVAIVNTVQETPKKKKAPIIPIIAAAAVVLVIIIAIALGSGGSSDRGSYDSKPSKANSTVSKTENTKTETTKTELSESDYDDEDYEDYGDEDEEDEEDDIVFEGGANYYGSHNEVCIDNHFLTVDNDIFFAYYEDINSCFGNSLPALEAVDWFPQLGTLKWTEYKEKNTELEKHGINFFFDYDFGELVMVGMDIKDNSLTIFNELVNKANAVYGNEVDDYMWNYNYDDFVYSYVLTTYENDEGTMVSQKIVIEDY